MPYRGSSKTRVQDPFGTSMEDRGSVNRRDRSSAFRLILGAINDFPGLPSVLNFNQKLPALCRDSGITLHSLGHLATERPYSILESLSIATTFYRKKHCGRSWGAVQLQLRAQFRKENAMATLRKRNGKWKVEIRKVGFPSINRTFLDKTSARKFAQKIEASMDANTFEDFSGAKSMTLKMLLIRYRNEITANKKGAMEETSKINLLLKQRICLHSLMTLRSHHLYAFKNEWSKGRAAATVNKYFNIMRHAWTTARRVWGIATPPQNPFDFINLDAEAPARDRVLTHREYAKLLYACSLSNLPPLKDAVEFAYLTGCRQGEQLRLKLEHIDFDRKVLTFYNTKNGEDRTIPISDAVIAIIKRNRFGPFIFNVLKRRLRKHFVIAMKKADIKNFRWHDLRACFCTNALIKGWTIAQVATVSGHRDWSQLKRYARIKADDLVEKINTLNVVNINK